MAGAQPFTLGLDEASARIREKSLSPVGLTESCLSRIEQLEPLLQAWALIDREGALRDAQKLEREQSEGRWRGPLHGVPIGIKDIFHTAGLPTRAGLPRLFDFTPDFDAAAVERLRQAGAIILGKTTTAEFAAFDPPATRNPWNPEHTPGGSSSGSAAAVAARMCAAAIGSQTGGSTIRPASYCGIVGLKATFGRISCYGAIELAHSMDHVGIFARSVADAALMLQALAGYDPRDPRSSQQPVPDFIHVAGNADKPPRIGVLRGAFRDSASKEVREHVQQVAQRVAKAGARIEELDPPASFEQVGEAFFTMLSAEAAAFHQQRFEKHASKYGPKLRGIIERGLAASAVQYIRAREDQRRFRIDAMTLLDGVDVLLTPSSPTPAPKGLGSTGDYIFNAPWSFSGMPVIGLPSGIAGDGLPLGIQLVGSLFAEDRLLAGARWCEAVLDFNQAPVIS